MDPNQSILNYVEAMFSSLPKTKDIVEVKCNILEHMQDEYEALLAQGKNENEALGIVITSFGSIDEIKSAFAIPDAGALAPPAEEPDPGRLKEEYQKFLPCFRLARAVSVALFIMAPILSIAAEEIMLLFLSIAAGVALLIFFEGRAQDYRELLFRHGAPPGRDGSGRAGAPGGGRRRGAVYALIVLSVLITYLILGFLFQLWHPGWILFLCVPIFIIILELFRRDESN